MKLAKTMLAVAVVGLLFAAGLQAAAQTAGVPARQLLDEAKKLYAAHDYAGALKRLQQVNRGDLGFFEKGSYDSLLDKAQKGVEAKAADEKAFIEGQEALAKKRYATAVEKLAQAAASEYLDDEKSGQAKGLHQLAADEHARAVENARVLLAQARAALKEGQTADAKRLVGQIEAMDVRLGFFDRRALADVTNELASAESKPAEKAPSAAPAPAAKPAVATTPTPAPKPVEKTPAAPVVPVGPTAKDLLKQAGELYDDGKIEEAQKTVQKIERADLGFFDKLQYDRLSRHIAKAIEEKNAPPAAPKPAEKAPAASAQAPVTATGPKPAPAAAPPASKPATIAVASAAETKPAEKTSTPAQKPAEKTAEKPAAKPAEKPAEKPATPPAPTAKDQLAEAQRLFDAGQYDAAQKQLQKINRDDLGWLGGLSYDSLTKKVAKAIEGKAAAEKALVEGKEALAKKRYTAAIEQLGVAADSKYLPADKSDAAKAAYQMARDEHAAAVAEAKGLMEKAYAALDEGKVTDARKTVDSIKAMDIRLGWLDDLRLGKLDKRVAAAEADLAAAKAAEKAPPAVASKPAEAPKAPASEPAAATPKPAAPPTTVAAAPTPKPAEPKAPAPAPAAAPAPPPAAPAKPTLTLAQQAKRAEADEETRLGDDCLARHEYEKARIHFSRALSLWPDSAKAKQGLDKAMKLLAEREEPLADVVRDVRALERQRITAAVQELLAQAEREMGRAERPEDYTEALRPLSQADRTIDAARVLSAEEQERLREEVYVLRKEIMARKAEAETARAKKAAAEAAAREEERRRAYLADQSNKVRQLWERATELRRSMQFNEAIEVLDRLIAVDPNDERALRWREDLLYLEAQARQVRVKTERKDGAVEAFTDVEEAAIHPGEKVRGEIKYLRYPEAKAWKDLTEFRRDFTKAVSAEPKAVAETRRRLAEEIDLDFEKTSLDNVLKYISEVQRGLNIVIDPDVATAGIDLTNRVVDLKVKQVSVESVLGLILGTDLGYKVESGYILVTTKEKLQQNLPVVTYPVQDLVAQIPDFGGEAPRFEVGDVTQAAAQAAGGGGAFGDIFGGGGAQPTDQPVGWQELVDIIQRTVNNGSDPGVAAWSDEGGPAAVEFMNGLLIITQTRRGHEKVADLLEQLRRERAIMVSVESRFCQVSDQFLQDITLDVDVAFLNTGNRGFTGPSGAPFAPIQDPAAGPNPPYFDTLPGIPPDINYPVVQGQPIIISGTGSNGLGTSKLLPLAGSAFQQFIANEGGMTVSGVFLDDVQVGFLLRAIQADVRSTTLQAPRITLYNGQRSYISVSEVTTYIADVEPVVAEAAVGWDPTIGAIPVGVTLDVKATVSADRRYVQMDLRPQLATLGTPPFAQSTVTAAVPALGIATATIDLPRVLVQDFKTTVSVPDGGTLLLGGTRRFIETDAETGVPVLSKLPILKRLFNNRASLRQAHNLLILVRPKIIIQAEEEHNLGYDNF